MPGAAGPAIAPSGISFGIMGPPDASVVIPAPGIIDGIPPGPPPDALPASGHESAHTDSQLSSHFPAGPIDAASDAMGTMQQTCDPLQMMAPHCTPSPS